MKPITVVLACSLAANAAALAFIVSRPAGDAGTGPAKATATRAASRLAGGTAAGSTTAAGEADSAAEGSAAVAGSNPVDPLAGRIEFSSRIAAADLDSVQRLLSEVSAMAPSAARADYVAQIYRRWGELDPENAIAAIAQLPPSEKQAHELDILKGWALQDPAAAFDWMDRNPPQITSATTNPPNAARFQALADTLLEADRPDLLETALSRTKNDAERSLLSVRVADYLARYNAPEALDWMLGLPAGPARTSAAAKIARTIAEDSPDLALGLASKLPGNAGRNQAIASVFAQWADTGDPTAAESWLSAQKPAPAIDSALVAFVPVTAARDQAAAARLLDQFSQPDARQRAVDLAANKIALEDPVRALEWTVQESPESADRVKKLTPFARTWIKSDPTGAANAIGSMPGLTNSERDALTALLPPPPPPPKK